VNVPSKLGFLASLRPWLVRALRWAPKAMLGVGTLALIVRFTVRDAWPLIATFHYATPPSLVAAGGSVAAVLAARRRRRSLTIGNLVLAAVALWAFVATSHFTHDAAPAPVAEAIRGVLWNVQRGRGGWKRVAQAIAARDPDIVFLVEPGHPQEGAQSAIAAALPGHRSLWIESKALVFVRGTVELREVRSLAQRGTAAELHLVVRGRTLAVVVADITSSPLRPRAPMLSMLWEFVAPLRDEPALVVGDFNTPRRSVHLDGWRRDWTHAFEAAGNGFDGTWPAWFPVLAIDHVWASRSLEVTRCELLTTWASDHRMVIFEIR